MSDVDRIDGLPRRVFVAGGGLAAMSLASCDLLATDPDQTPADGVLDSGASGHEAPMLAAPIRNGELPPLEERLPGDPLVIQPIESVGRYGGAWRTAVQGPADGLAIARTVGLENLLAWRHSAEWTGRQEDLIPNLATSWDVNSMATEFVFRLRPGVKWSDGEPFTADDVVFVQNDVLGNEELFPAQPNPAVAKKIDDDTVAIVLSRPDGLFLQHLATPPGDQLTSLPFHYLKDFHPGHNPDVDQLVRDEGVDDWVALFQNKSHIWSNPDLPTLRAWQVVSPLGDGTRVVVERNPYYWKTDPGGNQLPYLDEIVYEVIDDIETMTLKAANGEFDFHTRHINPLQNKPILARSRDTANFDFVTVIPSEPSNTMVIQLNLAHKDRVKREIFQNRDFRVGLSYAIDRGEIIATTLQRQGEPAQHGPRPGSAFYHDRLFTQYTEFDVTKANEHLDRAGYSARSDEGIRLGPDDNPIVFTIDTTDFAGMPWTDMLELIKKYWRDVGVEVNIAYMDRSLMDERKAANEHDAMVWTGQGGLEVILRPGDYLPVDPGAARYAVPWAEWYASGGASGEEPPAATKVQLRLYDAIKKTIDPDEQETLMKQILDMAAEQFYCIGISLLPESYAIVRNDFHNVPDTMIEAWFYNTPGSTNPCQYFSSQ